MATAEQNTLLGLQLFSPVAQQFEQGNANKVATLLKLIALNREEQLKRDLATQGYDKSIQLANMTADREDTRQLGAERRQGSQLEALQRREDTRAAESERKQNLALDAADVKQIRAEVSKAYPIYVDEATNLGEEPLDRTEFDDTVEGLGALQAEMAKLRRKRLTRDQTAAAEAVTGELDDAIKRRDSIRKELESLSKPTPQDIKFATANAVDAVRKAIESGELTGVPKANSDAAKKGIAALASGNLKEAESLLGSNARVAFEKAFEASLEAAPNFKNRLQQVTVKSRELQDANNFLRTVSSDLRKAAATNLPLATKLGERRSALQDLQTSDEPVVSQRRTLDQIFGAPPATTSQPAARGATTMALPGLIANPTNEPLIAAENQRRQTSALSSEQDTRRDAYGSAMDRLLALQAQIGDVRSGDPEALARTVNPMGGYIPGAPVDTGVQAATLGDLLQQVPTFQQQLEDARRKMLWLQGGQN